MATPQPTPLQRWPFRSRSCKAQRSWPASDGVRDPRRGGWRFGWAYRRAWAAGWRVLACARLVLLQRGLFWGRACVAGRAWLAVADISHICLFGQPLPYPLYRCACVAARPHRHDFPALHDSHQDLPRYGLHRLRLELHRFAREPCDVHDHAVARVLAPNVPLRRLRSLVHDLGNGSARRGCATKLCRPHGARGAQLHGASCRGCGGRAWRLGVSRCWGPESFGPKIRGTC